MKKKITVKDDNLKRVNSKTLLFNTHEIQAINKYCTKYRITNRAKFMREAIITEVLRRFDADYPSLFDDQPNLFQANKQN